MINGGYFEAAVLIFESPSNISLMVFVFTAVILFFAFLFWNIDRLNRMSSHETIKMRSSENS
jgi:hypothetical protein